MVTLQKRILHAKHMMIVAYKILDALLLIKLLTIQVVQISCFLNIKFYSYNIKMLLIYFYINNSKI